MMPTPTSSRDIYFLIHGAWHAGWCWDYFVPLLKTTKPCDVHVLNLSGMGLADYVQLVSEEIKKQDRPVILVGHSLAGLIVSQVGENLPHHVKQIIYIAAYIPENQHSMRDEIKNSIPGQLDEDLIFHDDMIELKKTENVKRVLYTQCDDALAARCLAKLEPEPARSFIETISITAHRFGMIPKKYIACLQDQAVAFVDQKRMYERLTYCEVINLMSDHSPFLSMPQALADVFSII
jgi:pimeloyl-ACP methyl ester carboxylesterase